VLGAAGRMGRVVCFAVAAAPDMELVAAVDPAGAGEVEGVRVSASPEALVAAGAEVVVDFTVREAVLSNARFCAEAGIHMVIGTTGLSAGERGELERIFEGGRANAVVAPNFSIGAVLMMHFAEVAARFADSAEIIELHHQTKRDAPSGTALETAERIAEVRSQMGRGDLSQGTEVVSLPGSRGGESKGGVRVHSVRLPGLVAHQEVIFGMEGQVLTIRHDSLDRSSFMPGVLLALRRVAELPGVTWGLEALVGL
jgi:4-hydroxy-tetrahydrodipicolinate reductase